LVALRVSTKAAWTAEKTVSATVETAAAGWGSAMAEMMAFL
jgi:hypothetical protein